MKNILEEAIRVGVRSQGASQGPVKQRIKCFRKQADSPGPDGQDSDIGTEGYTSGALSSEDEFVINSQRTDTEFNVIRPQVLLARLRPLRLGQHLCTKSPVQVSAQLIMSRWPH